MTNRNSAAVVLEKLLKSMGIVRQKAYVGCRLGFFCSTKTYLTQDEIYFQGNKWREGKILNAEDTLRLH